MKLYEIDAKLESIIAKLDMYEELGVEAPSDLQQELDSLEFERRNKIGNIARFIKNLDAEADAIKQEERKLKARRESSEKKRYWLYNYLGSILNQDETYADGAIKLSWRKQSDKLIVDNPLKVPSEFLKIETSVRVQEIKNAWKLAKDSEDAEALAKLKGFSHIEVPTDKALVIK